jgi:hypothetical protein
VSRWKIGGNSNSSDGGSGNLNKFSSGVLKWKIRESILKLADYLFTLFRFPNDCEKIGMRFDD